MLEQAGSADMTSLYGRQGYPSYAGYRDLRFDFMRGFAMLSVVAAHLEFFSWFNFLFWERLGIISAAEMFVVTAGLVLGLVNRKVVEREGMARVTERLWRRSFVLWRALVVTVLLIIVVRSLGLIDMTAVTTFTDRFAGQVYPMIPAPEVPWYDQLALVLTMRVSPHQIQILGLYVFLLAGAPLALWLLHRRLLGVFFGLTWALYFAGWQMPPDTPLLGMQFEYAFPLMMYQVLFTHALAVGFFRVEIAVWLADPLRRRLAVGITVALALGFFIFAQATPNPSFPAWSRLNLILGERFQAIYDVWFVKKHPGLLRLLNVAAFFGALYALLTYFWQPLNKALGWLLIPLGEASLYVFLMHLIFIVLIDQIPGYFDVIPDWNGVWPTRIWINTALYLGTMLGLWALVKNKVLFSVVPR
ncbi:Acyltransferase family domain protein [Rubellimicrobium mesophilum DSM 19309]|uniref:Acyltransferase family domain protein n=2 Tax=Rubellimicrobium TaxID=295418 RepID=A0A017HPE5_9RHOB|nr:Acyltransferase family domain protein [Rubellimicrobium mesophilum DSM 19309]